VRKRGYGGGKGGHEGNVLRCGDAGGGREVGGSGGEEREYMENGDNEKAELEA